MSISQYISYTLFLLYVFFGASSVQGQPRTSHFVPLEGKKQSNWIEFENGRTYSINYTKALEDIHLLQSITIPEINGSLHTFDLTENGLIPQKLKGKFGFGSWDGLSQDGQYLLKLDYTDHGFRAWVLGKEENYYLEPLSLADKTKCAIVKSYSGQAQQFHCYTDNAEVISHQKSMMDAGSIGGSRREFVIAVAATGEYTQYYGGSVSAAMSGIITTLNRVNAIYERDFSTRFILHPDNDLIIHADPDTDPYANGNLEAMINQNQSSLYSILGEDTFDLGHVFSNAGGGLARINGICGFSNKAKAVTGLPQPQGDKFNVDYVCHEIGHQLGARHTYNNCAGDYGGLSGVEPGSGSSIMSYAGICASTDVQAYTDQAFHIESLLAMEFNGNSCADFQSSTNTSPVLNILSPVDKVLPIGTPFYLEAEASDSEDQQLLFSWDQRDNTRKYEYGVSNPDGPLIRFRQPNPQPIRYIPALSSLASGTHLDEVVPMESRNMNFYLTVRDQHPMSGITAYESFDLEFDASAGPFKLLFPTTADSRFDPGSTVTVNWEVANTDQEPINVQLLSIFLSTDGGMSFPNLLAPNVINDGSFEVNLPEISSNNCRLMIKANDHMFFAVSEQSFSIAGQDQTEVDIQINKDYINICSESTKLIELYLNIEGNINNQLFNLELVDPPPGVTASFVPNTEWSASSQIQMRLDGLSNLGAGEKEFTLRCLAQSGAVYDESYFSIQKLTGPPPPALFLMTDYQLTNEGKVELRWLDISETDSYVLQVFDEPSLNLVEEELFFNRGETNHTYYFGAFEDKYFRMATENACGRSDFTELLSIRSEQRTCLEKENANTALINDLRVNSVISIHEDFEVHEVELKGIRGSHEDLGLIDMALVFPNARKTIIKRNECFGEQTFDFGIKSSADQFVLCPLDSGLYYKPMSELATNLPISSAGQWGLEINNADPVTSGILEQWTIELCGSSENLNAEISVLHNELIPIDPLNQVNISSNSLEFEHPSAKNEEILLIINTEPIHGRLIANSRVIRAGEWLTQNDINQSSFHYDHQDSNQLKDSFKLDVQVVGKGILRDVLVRLEYVENPLTMRLEAVDSIKCPENDFAEVNLRASGGQAPYLYKYNNSGFAASNIITDLPKGKYIFTVQDDDGKRFSLPEITIIAPDTIAYTINSSFRTINFNILGGTPPYLLSLDNGPQTMSTQFADISDGSHTLRVEDANSCFKEFDFSFQLESLKAELIDTVLPTCYDSFDGTISCQAQGGLPPYRYSINNGPLHTSGIFSNLKAGIYFIRIVDAENAIFEINGIHLESPDQLTVQTEVSDQKLEVYTSGGTPPYFYSLDGEPYQSDNVFNDLDYGIHDLSVRDANACVYQVNFNVSASPISLSYSLEGEILCHGDNSVTLNANTSGGIAPYTYELSGLPEQLNAIFSNLSAGNYNLKVKDAQGTEEIINGIRITQPEDLYLNYDLSGDSLLLIANGGVKPYTYALNGATYKADSLFIQNFATGLIELSVKDANGCIKEKTVSINRTPLNMFLAVLEDPRCYDTNDGKIQVLASGGMPPYAFSLDDVSYKTDSIFDDLAARQYFVYVQDAQGTKALSNPVNIVAPLPLVAGLSQYEDSISVMPFGGTGVILVSLDGSDFSTTTSFSDLALGQHRIDLIDENLCEHTMWFEVTTVNSEENNIEEITVFPNPFSGHLSINSAYETGFELLVIDALGRTIIKTTSSSKQYVLNTDSWPSGVYWLSINNYLTKRILK